MKRSKRILSRTIKNKGLLITTCIILTACASPEARKTERYIYTEGRTVYVSGEQTPKEDIVSTLWDAGERGYVRIVRMEDAAQGLNDHPVNLTPGQIRDVLGELRVANGKQVGDVLGQLISKKEKDSVPVFTEDQLDRIAEPLAAALAQAGPRQEVTFAVAGEEGLLQGVFQSPVLTTGRVFYKNGQLNVIFGLVHNKYRDQLRATGVLRAYTPGSRARQLTDRTILPDEAMQYASGERQDWIQVSSRAWSTPAGQVATAEVQPGPTPGIQPSPPETAAQPEIAAPPPRSEPDEYSGDFYRTIEMRLKRLIRLREQGLITEQEYQQRRRAIISEL